MNIMRFDLKIKCLSPLAHFGDEMCGTMQTARRIKYRVGDRYIDVPVYSGNALRGILRGLLMQDLLEKLDMSVKSISQAVFYTLFNGGSLKSGGIEDLEFKDKLTECCPALVLMGSAFGNQMTEGKAKVGILRPICCELNDYNTNQTDTSLYSGMINEVFQTRHDRLKAKTENVSDAYEVPKETVQMKYEFEVLSPGTELETEICVEYGNELEQSCMAYAIELLKQSGHLGGKSSEGYGKVEITCDSNVTGELYNKFVDENKDKIKEFLEYLKGYVD